MIATTTFRIDIWNDLQQDFIAYRENGKVKTFTSEVDAAEEAMGLTGRTNQPTKVVYVRRQFTDQRSRRGRVKASPVYRTTLLDGERVRIIGVINSKGEVIK